MMHGPIRIRLLIYVCAGYIHRNVTRVLREIRIRTECINGVAEDSVNIPTFKRLNEYLQYLGAVIEAEKL